MTREIQVFGDLKQIEHNEALWHRITMNYYCPVRLRHTLPSKLCDLWREFLAQHDMEPTAVVHDSLVQAFVVWLGEEV